MLMLGPQKGQPVVHRAVVAFVVRRVHVVLRPLFSPHDLESQSKRQETTMKKRGWGDTAVQVV